MRWLMLILLALVIGFILGPFIQSIPGSVILVLDQYSIQMRLWQAVVMVFGATLLFIFLYHLIARVMGTAGKFQRWSGSRRFIKARQKTIQGMIALSEGHWLKAEKLLTQAVKDTDTGLINYLAAAQAAQAQKADDRRDNYLRLAHIAEPGAEVAIGLTQAQLQLSNGQMEEALASLTHLQQLAPNHGHVLLLLSRVYKRLGEWGQILKLVPALKKSGSLSDSELIELERSSWLGQLEQQAEAGAAEGLQSLWASMTKKQRQDDVIAYQYLKSLIKVGASMEAEKPLLQRIKKDKSEPFLALYGSLETENGNQQLLFVEKLADKFNQGYVWSLTAGRLSLKQKIWGKAKTYLEQAIAQNPTDEAKTLLAIAMDRLGEQQQAYEQMKSGWPADYHDV